MSDDAGHAAHFLRRIDRLNPNHAELALGLYNDAPGSRLQAPGSRLQDHRDAAQRNVRNRIRTRKVRAAADFRNHRKPYVAPTKPGRNEPCSCGSGKKYKRCCGMN